MSRVETEDAAAGVRVVAFNRPEVRNAFDTAMYQEVTAALRAADADEAVGAVRPDRARQRLHLGPGPGRDGRHRHRHRRGGLRRRASWTSSTAIDDISVPLLAAVNGVAVGLGFTLLAHCDLVLVDAGARLRVPFAELGVPAEAASSVLFPAAMGWQQAARILLTSDWVAAEELVGLGLALQVCDGGDGPRRDGRAGGARSPPIPAAATRAITSLMRAARRDAVREANRREQAAFAVAARCRGRRRHPGRVRGQGRRPVLTVRLGITAALTDLDADARRARRGGRGARASTRSTCPSTRTCPSAEDVPPALVEGVRLDDYKRCLDPLVALATAAAVTTRIGLGTGILLVAQHDPIVLAKQVATLDHLSGGRVTLGVGFGWNRAEAEDHGVDFAPPPRRRARAPGRHGGHLVAPTRPSTTASSSTSTRPGPGPSRVQQPRVRTLVGGGASDAVLRPSADCADGWIPIGGRGLGDGHPAAACAGRAGRP